MVKITDASACQRHGSPRMGGLVLLGVLALTSCGPLTHATPAGHSWPPSLPHLITFDSGTSYAQALREVTDHGIQPGEPCPPEWQVGRNLTLYTGVWQPQGQVDTFAQSHQLYVWFPNTTGNREFEDQVTKLAHVLSISTPAMTVQGIPGMPAVAPGDIVCSAVLGALPAGTAGIWTPLNWSSSIVTFAAPLTSYDAALYSISNLGLGLDGSCYNSAPAAGQEQTFATTHTLTVQTTSNLTSTTWQQQLSATPEVVSVAPPTDHKAC